MSETPDTPAPAAEPIPTDLAGMVEYLRTSQQHPEEIAEQLAVQLGEKIGDRPRAYDLVTCAQVTLETEQDIIRRRAVLTEAMSAALAAVDRASYSLRELRGDKVYDVEYAEGGRAVNDLEVFLVDAGRCLRAAAAINPCPTEPGEPQ
jgi:hypothetical protein